MIDATPEIHEAVRAALMAAPGLAAVGERVSTDWALQLEPPYIRLKVSATRPFEDDCGMGTLHTLLVLVFTRARGAAAGGALVDSVRRALDNAALPLATSDAWWCQFREGTFYTDPADPALHVSRLTYEIVSTNGA